MLKPLQDYILVKPLPRRQSDVLVVVSYEKYSRGVVISCGPGEIDKKGRLRPMDVKAGDFITYGTADGSLDKLWPTYIEDGVTYRILQEKDITFISDPEFIAVHDAMSDDEIDGLIKRHNQPQGLAA